MTDAHEAIPKDSSAMQAASIQSNVERPVLKAILFAYPGSVAISSLAGAAGTPRSEDKSEAAATRRLDALSRAGDGLWKSLFLWLLAAGIARLPKCAFNLIRNLGTGGSSEAFPAWRRRLRARGRARR